MKTRNHEELVNIGRVNSAVGLKGEVRITLHDIDSENMKEGKVLLLVHAKGEMETKCQRLRNQNGKIIAKFEGVDDRTTADQIRGMEIFVRESDLEELSEGQHYVRDIVGYAVYDKASNQEIGKLCDVIQNTAQSVMDIKADAGKQVLIPMVDAFVKKIDDEREVIEVELIPGFLD